MDKAYHEQRGATHSYSEPFANTDGMSLNERRALPEAEIVSRTDPAQIACAASLPLEEQIALYLLELGYIR